MLPFLLILGMLCQLVGIFMYAQTYKYRTADYPWPEGWAVFTTWQPIWKMKQYYDPPGYRLGPWGLSLMAAGSILYLAVRLKGGHGPN